MATKGELSKLRGFKNQAIAYEETQKLKDFKQRAEEERIVSAKQKEADSKRVAKGFSPIVSEPKKVIAPVISPVSKTINPDNLVNQLNYSSDRRKEQAKAEIQEIFKKNPITAPLTATLFGIGEGFGYEPKTEEERYQLDQLYENTPKVAGISIPRTIGQIGALWGGTKGVQSLTDKALKVGQRATKIGNVASKVASSGLTGATQNTITTVGKGDYKELPQEALKGAAMNVVGDAAFGAVGKGISKAGKSLLNKTDFGKRLNLKRELNNAINQTELPNEYIQFGKSQQLANDINVPTKNIEPTLPSVDNGTSKVKIPKAEYDILMSKKNKGTINPFNNAKGEFILPNENMVVNGANNQSDVGYLGTFSGEGEIPTKVSKFRDNTLERSNDLTDWERENVFKKERFEYVPEKVSDWKAKAKANVEKDVDEVVSRLQNNEQKGGTFGEESNLITKKYLDEGRNGGSYAKALMFTKKVAETGRESGRLLKSLDTGWDKKSAEGAIVKAQRDIDNFEDAVKKQNPKIAKQLDDELNNVKKQTEQIKKDTDTAIDEAVKEINKAKKTKEPELNGQNTSFPQMLENKISNALKPKNPQEKSFIKQMISDLFGEAKEKIELPKVKSNKPTPMQKVTNTIKFSEYSGEIRAKAKQLLQEKFKDDPETLQMLENYFEKGYKPTNTKAFQSQLQKMLKDGGYGNKTLTSWVKDFYATGRQAKEDLVEALVKETGLDRQQAQQLKNVLEAKLHRDIKAKSDSLLENIMKPKEKGIVKTATQKISELTNIGLLENKKFADRISEKLSPLVKQMLKENNVNMRDIIKGAVQNDARSNILRDLINRTNLSKEDSLQLLEFINKEFNSLEKSTKEKMLQGMLKERNAAAPKTLVEKVREKINLGIYDDEVDSMLRDAVKEKYNLPTLKDDDVKFIVETMDSVKGLPENSEAYLEGVAKVEKLIREKTPASLSQKVGSGAFVSMLGNFTSPLKNIIGNTLLSVPEVAGNPLARGIDKVVKKIGGSEFNTVGKTDFGTLLKGAKQGVRSVKRDFLGGRDFKDLKGKSIKEISDILANPINTDTSALKVGDKFEVGNRLAFDNKVGRTAENLVGTAMKIGDIPFNKAYFEDTLQQLMKANNVTEPTQDMIETAWQVSAERTYKDSNELSDLAMGVKNFFNNRRMLKGIKPEAQKGLKGAISEIPQIIVNSLVPFAKTPANIVKRGLEYSPAGLIEGVAKLASNKGALTMQKQREIVDRLTRGTIGTGLLGAGYGLNKMGAITGERDSNKSVEDLKKDSGILPDALKVFGKTIDLKGLQPITTPIVAGSRLAKGDLGGGVNSALNGVTGALEQYTDLAMLQGIDAISTLVSSNSQPWEKEKALANIVTALPKQYTPSILKKLAYSLDPYERDLGKGMIDNIVGKLPLVSKNYPQKVDVYGNPKLSYDGKNNIANTLLNPFVTKTLKDNPLSKEALKLNKSDIDGSLKTGVIPKQLSTSLGSGVTLTPEQRNQYQKKFGDILNSKFGDLINSGFNADTDENRARLISKIIDDARDEAKTSMQDSLQIDTKQLKKDNSSKAKEAQNLYKRYGLKRAK